MQRVKDFAEPRIEPEIVFGLGRAPLPGMDEPALMECIDWVALGYEVVQSIFPGWKFTAADTIAANALHGALLVGNRHAVAPRKRAWQQELAAFRVEMDTWFSERSLHERGLVERAEDPGDRRVKRVAMTEAGHAVPLALDEARLSALSALIESLAEEEAQALGAALEMILAGREDIAAYRPPPKGRDR